MTAFPWKLFKGSTEIVFPRGARRYVQFDVRQIQSDGAVELDWNANAVWTGDAAFRLHTLTMSCSDTTVAPISDLWQGQIVTLHAPFEFAVPGPAATLKYDPVPGTVYGVDADDNPVGSTASGSRTVAIPGAVAIRFRPIMDCRIVSRSGPGGSQGRADASWSIELIELAGEVTDESGGDTISFASAGLRTFTVGVPFELNLNPLVNTNTGMPVVFAPGVGTLPPGLTLSTNGYITGTPTVPGLFVATVGAGSGTALAVQTIPFYAALPSVDLAPEDIVQVIEGGTVSLALAPLTTVLNTSAAAVYAVVSGALPAGVSLNTTTGLISGTTTDVGVFSVVVRASAAGATDDQTYAIQVIQAILDREAILSGGTTQTWVDNSDNNLKAQDFTDTETWTVVRSGWAEYALAGGAGPGGSSSGTSGAAGGGAGRYVRGRRWFEAGTYTVQIGASTPASTNNGQSSIVKRDSDGVNVLGAGYGTRGGAGGGATGGVGPACPSGGSSGGGGGGTTTAGLAGSRSGSDLGDGSSGSNGTVNASGGFGGGGGGYTSSPHTPRDGMGQAGGAGIRLRLWTDLLLCEGGAGGARNGSSLNGLTRGSGGAGGATGANGGNAAANTGSGGGGAGGGASGSRSGGTGASGRFIAWVREDA